MNRQSEKRRKLIVGELDNIKRSNSGDMIIKCNFNGLPYSLLPLTKECVNDDQLMGLLSNWRKKHEKWFQAQFEVTIEGTRKWFTNQLISTPDRILFMININNEYIGHLGLFRFDFETITCEIDNIVRGKKQYPGIMQNAIQHMMQWGRDVLCLEGYSLQVMSDNLPALRLYNKLGFEELKRVPLMRESFEGRVEWNPVPSSYEFPIEKHNVFMVLENETC